jgi:hypothetical protein
MDKTVFYKDATTGLYANSTNIPEPKVELRHTGPGVGLADQNEAYLKTNSTTYPFSYPINGIELNRIDGGPFVPHGDLQGRECTLAADASGAAVELNVRQYLTPDGKPILIAGGSYLLMHRHPIEKERLTAFSNADIAAEVVVIDASYDYTTNTGTGTNSGAWPKCPAIGTARKIGAVLQQIVATPASYNEDTGEFGYRYQQEQPTAITGVAAADGGTQKIDVQFNASTDKGIAGYMIQVLKIGDALCPYMAPTSIPDEVLPAKVSTTLCIYALDNVALVTVAGVITVSDISSAYVSSTRTHAAVSAGTYYVAVRAVTSLTLDASCRMSDVDSGSIDSVVVA